MDFPGHFQHIFQQLNLQRLHAQLCDCVVIVGGQKFQAHRSILAACSSHFRALLSSNESSDEVGGPGADKAGDGYPIVMALDPGVVTPEAFSTLLDMIYTSTLSLGASNVMDVLLAASHLHLNGVVKACKLHLSRKNFPASPPKGWRSVQHQQRASTSPQAQQQMSTTSVMVEDVDDDVVEVSQSGGSEVEEVRWRVNEERSATPPPTGQKRKNNEDKLHSRKRSYKDRSPTVTGSSVGSAEPGEPLLEDDLWRSHGEEEVEHKYEATKGEWEEIQLPSQSDSSTGGVVGNDDATDTVVKVKVDDDEGEEEENKPKMMTVEVKRENLSSCSQEVSTTPNISPSLPPSTQHLEINDVKMTADSPPEDNGLQSQLCSDPPDQDAEEAEESADADPLISLSELAFSCFLNPSNHHETGAVEEDDRVAKIIAAASDAAGDVDLLHQSPEANPSSAESSESSSLFPVTSLPLQQLLPTQGPGFNETLILQPTQTSLPGFFSGVRPGFGLGASLVQRPWARKNQGPGGMTLRRIAPKVQPGSEPEASSSSCGSAGESADWVSLTRASEDVLSKCKKAAAEDLVLLVCGEKKYACKICFKMFMNLTDCKKHIRVHTGEKPYPCTRCGKRFSQSSHLYKHLKNTTCVNWKDAQSLSETLH